MEQDSSEKKTPVPGSDTIIIAGIGPGGEGSITREVWRELEACDIIIGYTVYTELMKRYFPDKEYLSTPMRREEERCRLVFEQARTGKRVVMVCSGDAGVYGMAGLMISLLPEYPECGLKILSGVTAATAGAAVLGAPLMHDFAVISLSDLMTPWEKIEKRLRVSAEADLVICLYNPASRRRADYLKRACNILLTVMEANRVCGVVRQISREEERAEVMTLQELREYPADMFTTVYIGNSQARIIDGRMVTPRGYAAEKVE